MLEQLTAAQLQTVCPIVGSFVETLANSKLYDSDQQSKEMLSPWLSQLVGSRKGCSHDSFEIPRMFMLADFAVRQCEPCRLRYSPGRAHEASQLEDLPEAVNLETAILQRQAIVKCEGTAHGYGAISYACGAIEKDDRFLMLGVPGHAAHSAIYASMAAYSPDFIGDRDSLRVELRFLCDRIIAKCLNK